MFAKDVTDMTIDKFKMWKVAALKDFLSKKGLNSSGNKELLVARAFCAYENKMPDTQTAQEIRFTLAMEYQACLNVDGCRLPDPLELKVDWQGEKEAMEKWPPTMLSDISLYLSEKEHDVFSTEFRKRLLKDYKDQKSFSYFSSKWLYEVKYHAISNESEYCILKASCTPSQCLSSPPYIGWVAIKNNKKSDGKVMTAYCTCFAGYV